MDFDGYFNRILLCRVHHRMVDDQPHEYTVEMLRQIRTQHEQWVHSRIHMLRESSAAGASGVSLGQPIDGMVLSRLRTGKDAWNAVVGTSFYLLDSVDEDEASAEACDVSDGFLSLLRDTAEIDDAITDRGLAAVRDAQRDLRRQLDELAKFGLVAFGGRRHMRVRSGEMSPIPCTMAVAVVRPLDEEGIEDTLPVAIPVQQ